MPLDKIRILLTSPYDLKMVSGVNNQLFFIYNNLKGDGRYEVKILAPSSGTASFPDPNIITMGKVVKVPLNGSTARLALDFRIKSKVKAFLEKFDPQIIHLQEPFSPLLNHYVLKFSKAKNVGTFHSGGDSSAYSLVKPLLMGLDRKIDARIAVSMNAQNLIKTAFPHEYQIIPNGINPKEQPEIEETSKPSKKKIILFVGRQNEKRKGFQYLVEAMDLVEQKAPNQFKLIVVGPGEEQWKDADYSADIQWQGTVDDEALAAHYRQCDVVCLPSTGGESFGVILLEAFLHGKPAVASDIKGYRDVLVDGKCGHLVPSKTPAAICDALIQTFSDKSTYEDMSAYVENYVKQFHWDQIGPKITGIYDKLLGHSH